jgi:hypothetical protein
MFERPTALQTEIHACFRCNNAPPLPVRVQRKDFRLPKKSIIVDCISNNRSIDFVRRQQKLTLAAGFGVSRGQG